MVHAQTVPGPSPSPVVLGHLLGHLLGRRLTDTETKVGPGMEYIATYIDPIGPSLI